MSPPRNALTISPFRNEDEHGHAALLSTRDEAWTEWWYANFHDTRQNLHAVLVFKMTVPQERSPASKAFVFFSMLGAQDLLFYEEMPADRFVASDTHCDVRAGASYFRSDGEGNYAIHMESRGKKSVVDLCFTKLASGFTVTMPGAAWTIGAPLARVHGTIVCGSKRLPIDGHGYHDHNWGATKESSVSWNWGSVGDPAKRLCVTFGKMAIPGKIQQEMVIVSNESGFQHSLPGDAEIQYLQMGFHGHRYPRRERILAQTDRLTVDMVVALERGHHAEDIDMFLSNYEGTVMIDGQTLELQGRGWWEYKYPRPSFVARFVNSMGARYAYLRDHAKQRMGIPL